MHETTYHIYNRGADRREVFIEHNDYLKMFELFNRYLGTEQQKNKNGYVYPHFGSSISLLSFCLIPNHFHIEVQATEPKQVSGFMQSLKTAYSRSFNLKYERSGVLFETRYRKRLVDDEPDYLAISRYIHLNALPMTSEYDRYPYSSLHFYLYDPPPSWLTIRPTLDCFDSPADYKAFHEMRIRELAAANLNV